MSTRIGGGVSLSAIQEVGRFESIRAYRRVKASRNYVEDRDVPLTNELMTLNKCHVFSAVSSCVEYLEGDDRYRTFTSFCKLPLYVF